MIVLSRSRDEITEGVEWGLDRQGSFAVAPVAEERAGVRDTHLHLGMSRIELWGASATDSVV